MVFIRKILVFAALCAPLVPFGLSAQTPNVVVSLKPIHSLVAGVMGEAGEPRLLLKGTASPHTYQMRPSDAQALTEADLIVWVGEAMETFLHRAIKNLGSRARVVTLHEVPGMRLLRNREGGIWEDDHHEEEAHVDEHEDHGHDHGEYNMHFWLDPGNAGRIVDEVAEALIFSTPPAPQSGAPTQRRCVAGSLLWTRPLKRVWHPCASAPSWSSTTPTSISSAPTGWTARAVAVDPARAPSAKRLVELRAALAEHKILCVFTEPQFEPDLVRTVVEGSDVRTAVLDPIGADKTPGPDAWIEIMGGLGDAMVGCLARADRRSGTSEPWPARAPVDSPAAKAWPRQVPNNQRSVPGPAPRPSARVSLRIGRRSVLDAVDLVVHTGEIVTLVGLNGAASQR